MGIIDRASVSPTCAGTRQKAPRTCGGCRETRAGQGTTRGTGLAADDHGLDCQGG